MKKLLTILTISTLAHLHISTLTIAQDIHFSQFFNAPLALNPALTGAIDGNFRAGINYRNQWPSIDFNPYVTTSVFADAALSKTGNWLGIGVALINDNAGGGDLKHLNIMFSIAWHQAIDKENKHIVSLGLAGGYNQKQINFNNFTFDNQWIGNSFDITLPNGEPTINNNLNYMDFHTGLGWHYNPSENLNVQAGIALFHLTGPRESFYSTGNYRLAPRPVVYGMSKLNIGEKLELSPGFLFMTQNNVKEVIVGSSLGYKLSSKTDNVFHIGSWYRFSGSFIVTTGLSVQNIKLSLSYDINTASQKTLITGKGGFELSLIYTPSSAPSKQAKPGL